MAATQPQSAKLTPAEIKDLYTIAVDRTRGDPPFRAPCAWIYRNQSPNYFADILKLDGGKMKTALKDNSGDPASPINGVVKGLFFLANNPRDIGGPPPTSVFGSSRFQVPARILLKMAPNLYFADFFCMKSATHYVTLVLTKTGSSADLFCRKKLLPLDLHRNPFLYIDGNDEVWVDDSWYMQIEVMYTEDIDMKRMFAVGAMLTDGIETIGQGHATPGGIKKNPNCPICNVRTRVVPYVRDDFDL